jgi:hypothetical protein
MKLIHQCRLRLSDVVRAVCLCFSVWAGLTGCSRPLPASPELFPLNSGWTWRYEMVTVSASGKVTEPFTVENLGFRQYGGGLEGWERRNSLGNYYLFRSNASGVHRVGARNEIEDQMRSDEPQAVRPVLKWPIALGTHWTAPSLPYLIHRTFDWPRELKYSKALVLAFEVEAVDEAVTVPAGTFKSCVQVVGRQTLRVYVDPVTGFQDIQITQREWYCPGVGLVKLLRDEPVAKSNFYLGGSQSFELVEWSRS